MYREQETTIDDGEEVESEIQKEATAKEVRDPGCPTSEERERQCKTHVPFRPWRPFCIEAKGVQDAAHRQARHVGEHEIHLIGIGCKSFGQSVENETNNGTALIVKDRDAKTTHGPIVSERGVKIDGRH